MQELMGMGEKARSPRGSGSGQRRLSAPHILKQRIRTSALWLQCHNCRPRRSALHLVRLRPILLQEALEHPAAPSFLAWAG
jgi:hypothetical protein